MAALRETLTSTIPHHIFDVCFIEKDLVISLAVGMKYGHQNNETMLHVIIMLHGFGIGLKKK